MSVLQAGFGSSGGYNIDNSVRLRASASAYLSRTFGAGNRDKWTMHMWFKRGTLNSNNILCCSDLTALRQWMGFTNGNDYFYVQYNNGTNLQSTEQFRDPSAWYDLVVVWDIANAISTDRCRVYINNKRLVLSGTMPSSSGEINNSSIAYIGSLGNTAGYYCDGLISNVHFIDGQALSPTDFSEYNTDGVWVPKPYTGAYGTNGCKLNFADAAVTSGSNAGLGKDVSGNGNYWNTTNISVTAGVTYDALTDTPTNNYCTLNPLIYGTSPTLSNGNLATNASGYWGGHSATIAGLKSGKWYVEAYHTNGPYGTYDGFGWLSEKHLKATSNQQDFIGAGLYYGADATYSDSRAVGTSVVDYGNGIKIGWNNGAGGGTDFYSNASDPGIPSLTYYAATTDRWRTTAIDLDAEEVWFGFAATSSGSVTWYPGTPGSVAGYDISSLMAIATDGLTFALAPNNAGSGTGRYSANFGQQPWKFTPPSGFKSLCTANLPSVAITEPARYFNAKTRVGTAATYSVTGEAFQPDFVWVKSRGRTLDHALYDSVRGVEKRLESNNTDAEVTGDTTGLTAFNSDGYTGGALDQINGTTATNAFVDWLWKAGGAPTTDNVAAAGATPTAGSVKIDGADLGSALAGSIAATRLSANTTVGFSICTLTASTSAFTFGHGLGAVPKLVIFKDRNNTIDWWVSHAALGTSALRLNTTAAQIVGGYWGTHTTSVVSVNSPSAFGMSASPHVAYCFAEIPGYSKFGSYTGNGSTDGPFVHLGFRPKYVLTKRTDSVGDWYIHDAARGTYNLNISVLHAQSSAAETTSAQGGLDFTATGFKVRNGDGSDNANGGTITYMAFAEHPFGGGNVAPAPAR